MKKQAKTQGKRVLLKADPIYKDVETIMKAGDPEKLALLRSFISVLAETFPQKKPR